MKKQATVLLSTLLLLAVCGCVQQGANQTQPTQAQNAPTESKPAVKYVEVSLLEY
jgi:hypothetical protein